MQGGEERQGSAGSGLPVLSCERQTFGRVITRRTALGVISDSCLFKVFGAHSLYGLRLPSLRLMFRLHLHEEESCMCQHKQCAYEAHQVCTCACVSLMLKIYFSTTSRQDYYIIVEYPSQLMIFVNQVIELASIILILCQTASQFKSLGSLNAAF